MMRKGSDPMAKMANAFRGHHQASKPPPGMKNPYSSSRQSSISSIPADKNFVNDNWDDDDDDGVSKSRIATKKQSSMKTFQSSVQADSNWLDDDFDN
jgi:hypothetical protein